MFNPVLFELGGLLLAGEYLLGEHVWDVPVTLQSARLVLQPPLAGQLAIALEVGGVLVGPGFVVSAGGEEVRATLDLDVTVPANTGVRWKISAFDSDPENAATGAAITVIVV